MTEPAEAILLIGPTGSGKTPLGDYIGQKGLSGRRCLHFDFGHQLRTVAGKEEAPPGFGSGEHQFIRDVLEKGLLLEDEHFPIAEKIIRNFIADRRYAERDLVILNGLPRHAGQARDIAGLLNVTALIILECSAEDVHERILANTGGDRAGRDDDSLELIRKKLEIFRQRTEPLIGHYDKAGSIVHRVAVGPRSDAGAVYGQIRTIFSA